MLFSSGSLHFESYKLWLFFFWFSKQTKNVPPRFKISIFSPIFLRFLVVVFIIIFIISAIVYFVLLIFYEESSIFIAIWNFVKFILNSETKYLFRFRHDFDFFPFTFVSQCNLFIILHVQVRSGKYVCEYIIGGAVTVRFKSKCIIHLANTSHSLSWVLNKYTTVFYNRKQVSWRRKRGKSDIIHDDVGVRKCRIRTKCQCTAVLCILISTFAY